MSYMFYNAHAFNRDIGSWNISSLTSATSMFEAIALPNRPLPLSTHISNFDDIGQ
jgi:hypothetical protein